MPRTKSLFLLAVVALLVLDAPAANATSGAARLPKLGSKVFAGQLGVGWGTYKPSEIFNGGDPTGRVQDIRWSSWGGPTTIGYGTGWYVGPNSDVAEGEPGRAELRASDLGHCLAGGPLTYRHLDVRGPAPPGGKLGPWYSWSGAKTLCQFGFGTPSTPTSPATIEASLPLVSCPTSYGVPPSASAPLPSNIAISVPSDLANQLAFYSDQGGIMELIAPRGWDCSALVGADGSSTVKVFPPGEQAPTESAFSAQQQEAIVGSQTSACLGCRELQACPLFSDAAADYLNDYHMNCSEARPAEETIYQINSGIIGFEDPPDVAGDGNPSGGPYPANGVMTYYSGNEDGSWLDTCTLPNSEHALCTVALNAFVKSYGSD
jgi:hypothetical protein